MAETVLLSDPGPLPELAWLPVGKCTVDPSYQRSLEHPPSPKHIEKIARNFRWARFQAVLAVKSGDGWRIVDGQHRVEAARRRGIAHIPAVVLDDLAVADQADAFVWANRDRVPVSAQAVFYAELAAGDPAAVTLDHLTRAAGIEIVRYRVSNVQVPLGKTTAVSALRRTLQIHGETITNAAIRAVAVFKTERGALRAELFRAAARYLDRGGSEASLTRSLTEIGCQALIEAAAAARGEDSRANAIVDRLRRANVRIGAKPSAVASKPGQVASSLPARAGEPSRPAPAAADKRPSQRLPRSVIPPKQKSQGPSDDEVAKFMAEKGVSLVQSPEQVAAFLRANGYAATVQVAEPNGRASSIRYAEKIVLGGKPSSIEALYRLANTLRIAEGLKPLSIPSIGA